MVFLYINNFIKAIIILFISLNITNVYANNIKNSAVVFMYHKFGISKYPTTSVKIEQFIDHIDEFTKEKYNIRSLDFIVDTIINDGQLPKNTIGISIDDADKSFMISCSLCNLPNFLLIILNYSYLFWFCYLNYRKLICNN